MTRALKKQPNGSRHLHATDLLRRKLLTGEVAEGEQLMPELELCREINLSRTTVRKAIADLVDEGLLVRYQGRGTFVNIRRTPAQKRLLGCMIHRSGTETRPSAYSLLTQGAEKAAAELGYQLVLANSQDDAHKAMEEVIRLNELKTVGTLVVPPQTPTYQKTAREVVSALQRAGQKIVLVDTPPIGNGHAIEAPCISSQNREAAYELTRHLIRLGHRRIAFLTSVRIGTVIEREEGFRQAMKEHDLPVPPEYFLEVAGTDIARQGRQELDVFLAMREPPQAIVCLHDLIALNVLKRCAERGCRVPDDIAVAGFDDLPQSAVCHPTLTTVHQPLFEMGYRAVQMLEAQLNAPASAVTTTSSNEITTTTATATEPPPPPATAIAERLPCRLVIRESCGAMPP
ncbi:substrate-binding domain-containing protein [Geminisphaera colitermitum]|uniref:GntR family transcriptional regulator n=1 Tax=Geminisphaera colitermitum TaxID=1148786 RepID=UPI000158CF5D|nr:GntR family transcriptional regulator [Geminisphaera colitermitum]